MVFIGCIEGDCRGDSGKGASLREERRLRREVAGMIGRSEYIRLRRRGEQRVKSDFMRPFRFATLTRMLAPC